MQIYTGARRLGAKAVRVAVLVNPASVTVTETTLRELPEAARTIGLQRPRFCGTAQSSIELPCGMLRIHERGVRPAPPRARPAAASRGGSRYRPAHWRPVDTHGSGQSLAESFVPVRAWHGPTFGAGNRAVRGVRPLGAIAASRIFFGWRVVAVAFTVTFFSAGIDLYGPSVYLQVLHQQRAWAVSTISAAVTTQFVISAAVVAFLADAYRRFGLAAVTRAGIAATTLGVVGWALAAAPWQLFGAAVLTGAGWATASAAAISFMVAPWFERRRAVALGHALNGMPVAGILFVPLWVILIDAWGFAAAACAVAAATLAILWPIAGRLLRLTPETIGVAPDGDPTLPLRSAPEPARAPASLRTLASHRGFASLSAAFALGMFAQIGLLAHLVLRLAPVFGIAGAAMALSFSTGCAIVGRLIVAALAGERDRRIIAAGNFVMQACGVALLAFATGTTALLTGCILFGLGVGNLLLLPPLIAQAEFARADVARVVGLVTAINQATFAFGPVFFGALHDVTGTYAVPFALAALVQIMAAGVVVTGRAP
jgi:MFS family permease